MKPQRIGRAAGAALLLSFALAGCGGANPSNAVVVGDQVVTESDVDAVVNDLRKFEPAAMPPRSDVAQELATTKYYTDRLAKVGVVVSDDEVRRSLPPETGEVSEQFLTLQRGQHLQGALAELAQKAPTDPKAAAQLAKAEKALQQGQAELAQMVENGTVKINPRYSERPAWLQGGDQPGGEVPQQPQEAPQGEQPAPAPSTPAG
ncbi:hypothetical protein [Gephyromycinifex aptenodytis]|uniref:hypothetical protein n=1 Tax=Gephyromycinifex aptenodytis TaxID=2716227 RepID=UPI001445BC9E|nr:hypothetical protein [Gephyromycinifex aptenodytis]